MIQDLTLEYLADFGLFYFIPLQFLLLIETKTKTEEKMLRKFIFCQKKLKLALKTVFAHLNSRSVID